MTERTLLYVSIFSICHLVALPLCHARADGGAVRLQQRAGGYQVAVFTAPTPLRAGPVDISVLVQDGATGAWLPEAQVSVSLKARSSGRRLECQATTASATNRLFHAAGFELPEPGLWDLEIAIDGPHGRAAVRFAADVGEAPPRWLELWPWYSWPALVIAFFGLHRLLRKRPRAVFSRAR